MLQHLVKKKKTRLPGPKYGAGFTLVELLAVLTIISLMAVIVLVRMGTGKEEGRDTGIKASLTEVRKAAEILYTNNVPVSYEGVCDDSDGSLANSGDFGRIENFIERNNGEVSCKDSDEAYAVISSLNRGNCWCVDSEGSSKEVSLAPTETCSSILTETHCP